jgi:hypothetical protein
VTCHWAFLILDNFHPARLAEAAMTVVSAPQTRLLRECAIPLGSHLFYFVCMGCMAFDTLFPV